MYDCRLLVILFHYIETPVDVFIFYLIYQLNLLDTVCWRGEKRNRVLIYLFLLSLYLESDKRIRWMWLRPPSGSQEVVEKKLGMPRHKTNAITQLFQRERRLRLGWQVAAESGAEDKQLPAINTSSSIRAFVLSSTT